MISTTFWTDQEWGAGFEAYGAKPFLRAVLETSDTEHEFIHVHARTLLVFYREWGTALAEQGASPDSKDASGQGKGRGRVGV